MFAGSWALYIIGASPAGSSLGCVRYSCFVEARDFSCSTGSGSRPGAKMCTLVLAAPTPAPSRPRTHTGSSFVNEVVPAARGSGHGLAYHLRGILCLYTYVHAHVFTPMCSLMNHAPIPMEAPRTPAMGTTPHDEDPWMLTAGGSASAWTGCSSGMSATVVVDFMSTWLGRSAQICGQTLF